MAIGYTDLTPLRTAVKRPTATTPPNLYTGTGTIKPATTTPLPNPNPTLAPQTVYANSQSQTSGGAGATGAAASDASGLNASNSNPYTGFASRYAPADSSTLYQNPQVIANDVLSQLGINTPGNRQLLGQNADAAFYLSFLLNGQDPSQLGDAASFNTMADIFKNQMTPGGASPDYHALMTNLLNPGALGKSALADYLNVADPSTQVGNLMQLLRPALNGINPLAQKGALAYAGDMGDRFLSDTAGGTGANYTGNFGNYLQGHGGILGRT